MKSGKISQNPKSLTRRMNTRELRRFLIVCEGEKTEPNYFKEFPDNPEVYDSIDIRGTGYNTISLVKKAITLKKDAEKRRESYIEVWCVFDKDDFSDDQFQRAMDLADKNQIRCAYSIEAFEIWYMLHFNYYDTGLSRKQYKGKLTELLGKPYQKNDKEMYQSLLKYQSKAIKHAQRLYEIQYKLPLVKRNPITTVFKLVERLLSL